MRMVNLVNDLDEVIGHTDLLDAHHGTGKKHQAVSLFLFHQNSRGDFELLIQQRSQEKIVGALQWANTLCANLAPKEDHLGCLKRRTMEELGIEWQDKWLLEKIMVFSYQIECENGFCENEIDHLFVSVLNDDEFSSLQIKPNSSEVADYEWFNWTLLKDKKVGEKKITPWTNLFLENQEIINKIDQVLIKCQK